MRTRISSAVATTLPLLLCLISSSVNATRHRHQQQRQSSENSLSASAESSTIAYNTRTAKPHSSKLNLDIDFDTKLSQTSPNHVKDYMKEFASRGLYECSAKYISTITKLQKLIAEAYAEYSECEVQIKNTPKTYEKTGMSVFDELLAEWENEDEGAEDDESTEVDSVEELRPRH